MNGKITDLMREIQSDERLLAIFRRYSVASSEEKRRFSFVRYDDTNRLDILYDDKPIEI